LEDDIAQSGNGDRFRSYRSYVKGRRRRKKMHAKTEKTSAASVLNTYETAGRKQASPQPLKCNSPKDACCGPGFFNVMLADAARENERA
jgi:hypothetical protein